MYKIPTGGRGVYIASSRPKIHNENIHTWKFYISCFDVSLVPREILKTEGDRSGGYRGNLDQSIVHGWVVDACCPAFCCARNSAITGHIRLAESAHFIRTMMCALTGHCVHQTCLQLNMCRTFWTASSPHNTGNNKTTGSWCEVKEDWTSNHQTNSE